MLPLEFKWKHMFEITILKLKSEIKNKKFSISWNEYKIDLQHMDERSCEEKK